MRRARSLLIANIFFLSLAHGSGKQWNSSDHLSDLYEKKPLVKPEITSIDTRTGKEKTIVIDQKKLKTPSPYSSFKKNYHVQGETEDTCCIKILTWLLDCVCCSN